MDQLHQLLISLLSNRVDRVNLLHFLSKLKVDVDEGAPFIFLKYKLQLEVAQILSKGLSPQENNRIDYERIIKESTEYLLVFMGRDKIRRTYHCTLTGCLFKASKHRDYLRHVHKVHSQETRIVCQFNLECDQYFSSLKLLDDHIDIIHNSREAVDKLKSKDTVTVSQPCKCIMRKCAGVEFSDVTQLIIHLRRDHKRDVIQCIFENCSKSFNNANSLGHHFNRQHKKLNLCRLKNKFKVASSNCVSYQAELAAEDWGVTYGGDGNGLEDACGDKDLNEIVNVSETDSVSEDVDNSNSLVDENLTENDEACFLMAQCDFLNQLTNVYFVPQSTVNVIAEEYLKTYEKSKTSRFSKLKQCLKECPSISDSDTQKVLKNQEENDPFLEAQEQLVTEYKRVKYLKENFVYIEPIEIILNRQDHNEKGEPKAVIHYVPIVESLKAIVQDPTFISMTEKEIQRSQNFKNSVKDIKDGELYRFNQYFQENPEAYTMILYSDAIELVNPLGAGKGKHKVIQIFFSLVEIEKSQRSKIDRIMLVAVFKESLIKRFGLQRIYKQLVADLVILEEGVTVHHPYTRIVKCGVLMHPADNLEAHTVGGFSKSFSSRDICRFCHCQYEDLIDNIHDYSSDGHARWTVEEFDKAASAAERLENPYTCQGLENDSEEELTLDSNGEDSDNSNVESFGVRHSCPLNALRSFHCVTGFPPDILHGKFLLDVWV